MVGPRSYKVVTEEGQTLRRTRCHLRVFPREEWKDSVVVDSEEAEKVDEEEAELAQGELEKQEEYREAKRSTEEHQGVDERNEENKTRSERAVRTPDWYRPE